MEVNVISEISLRPQQRYQREPDRNTLLAYWYLCSCHEEEGGARAVQKALGFSSPSTAVFHLEKLVDLGLVEKRRDGQYQILRYEKFGLMKQFFKFQSWWIPKHLVYALITTAIILIVIPFLFLLIGSLVFVALFPAILSVVIQWYEAVLVWKRRPSFHVS
ncbi:MAG: helix-turn-helix domain-containing protein [Candidatus Hermodarchaeia archaeon]